MLFGLFKLSKSSVAYNTKITWTIIILLFPVFGAVTYLIAGHKPDVR
ncbi:PLDc N-terminal domain-containing protein [Sinomicrobium soli]